MTPGTLIEQARADGVQIILTAGGRLRILGDQEQVDRYLPIVSQYQRELIAELSLQCHSGLPSGPLANDQGAGNGDVRADGS